MAIKQPNDIVEKNLRRKMFQKKNQLQNVWMTIQRRRNREATNRNAHLTFLFRSKTKTNWKKNGILSSQKKKKITHSLVYILATTTATTATTTNWITYAHAAHMENEKTTDDERSSHILHT